MNQTEIRGATALALIYLMRMLGLFMVMPVIAVFVKDYPDYSVFWLGLAIGAYGLTQAILQIPMGIWSDKIGRKPVIVLGLSLFALGSLLAAFADNMLTLTLGRMLQGAGAIAGAVMALAADVSREQQRSKVMAIIGIAIGFSFYLALILGPLISADFGLEGIFILTAILAILGIPLVMFAVPNVVVSSPSGDTLPSRQDITTLFFDSKLMKLNISVMLLHAMITIMFVQLPDKWIAAGWPLETHWRVYLPVLLASVVGLSLLMFLQRTLRLNAVLLASVLFIAVSFFWHGLLYTSSIGLFLLSIVFFTGFNFLEANFPALVSNLAPAGRKGTAMGIFASFQFFGAFLGGMLSGFLLQYISSDNLMLAMSLICLFWSLIFIRFDSASRLKRYTLALNDNGRDLHQIKSDFQVLAGVNEFVIDPEQQAVYLKVDGDKFDLKSARLIADPSK